MVTPFSLGMLAELLGELGPEPGALLQAESRVHKDRDVSFFSHIPAFGLNVCVSKISILHKHQTKPDWLQPEASPAMSRERFLAVAMGPSFLRSRGLLRRSVTFCFSRDRSFRLGSDADQTQRGRREFQSRREA